MTEKKNIWEQWSTLKRYTEGAANKTSKTSLEEIIQKGGSAAPPSPPRPQSQQPPSAAPQITQETIEAVTKAKEAAQKALNSQQQLEEAAEKAKDEIEIASAAIKNSASQRLQTQSNSSSKLYLSNPKIKEFKIANHCLCVDCNCISIGEPVTLDWNKFLNNDSKFNSNFPETFTVNGKSISDKNKLKELTVKKIKGIWPWSGDTLPYYTLPHNEEFIYILKPLVTASLEIVPHNYLPKIPDISLSIRPKNYDDKRWYIIRKRVHVPIYFYHTIAGKQLPIYINGYTPNQNETTETYRFITRLPTVPYSIDKEDGDTKVLTETTKEIVDNIKKCQGLIGWVLVYQTDKEKYFYNANFKFDNTISGNPSITLESSGDSSASDSDGDGDVR